MRSEYQRFFSLPRLALVFLIWSLISAWYWASLTGAEPLDHFTSPKDTLMLICEQDMYYFDGIAKASPSWRQFNYWLYGTPEENSDGYVAAFDELIRWYRGKLETDNAADILAAQLSQSVLLAERGKLDKAFLLVAELEKGELEEISGEIIRHAYGTGKPVSQSDWKRITHLLGDGWFTQRLRLRSAEQLGDSRAIAAYQQVIDEKADIRVSQSAVYILLASIPIVLGLIVVGGFLSQAKNRTLNSLTMQANDYFYTWNIFQGAGVYFRSQSLWMVYFIVLVLLSARIYWLYNINLLWIWGSLFAALPMLYLIQKYLLQPQQLNLITMFGLSPAKFGYWRLCKWSAALVAIDGVLNTVIGWVFSWFNYQSPLLEGISEYLLTGTPWEAVMEMINAVAWAPLMEEILFRGLVYLSLRSILKPVPAIIISAAIFSALHFYSVTGFISVFIAGAVWAWAYERSHSLLPGMIAHGISNFFWAAGILLYYR